MDGTTYPDDPTAPEPYRFRLGNRPPLTGIRALALFTVLTYHSNFETLPGTWVALQVFFVLSGFLITAMLAGEGQRNGRISLGAFYARPRRPPPPPAAPHGGAARHLRLLRQRDRRRPAAVGRQLRRALLLRRLPPGLRARPLLRVPGPDLVAVRGGAVLHPLVARHGGRGRRAPASPGLRARHRRDAGVLGRPAVPRVPRPPLRQRGVRPRLLRLRLAGRRPLPRVPARHCWPPTATSTGGPGGPAA